MEIKLKQKPTISCHSFPTTYDFVDINGVTYYFWCRYGNWELCYDGTQEEIASGIMGRQYDGTCPWDEAKELMKLQGVTIIE